MNTALNIARFQRAKTEEGRLQALRDLKLLDTPAAESFDRVTRMASQLFDLPIAAVSLTDCDRQWFKSRVGLDHSTIPRDKAPCAQVAETGDVLVVPDFLLDGFYKSSGLAHAGIRFYAGAPLVTREGYGLGSLCVLGTKPRSASAREIAALVDMAAIVMAQIELQHAFGRIDPLSGMPNRHQFIEDLTDLARDRGGEDRIAVVVDLATSEQLNKIVRVVGTACVDDMVGEAARLLNEALGSGRTAYHVGATQFAFLSPPDAENMDDLRVLSRAMTAARGSSAVRFATTVAIGFRPFRLGEIGIEDVLRGANGAAQDARSTEDCIALYSSINDSRHSRQYQLLHDFGVALTCDDQLRLVFQPRINLASGACVGAEALLRWDHPVLGEVGPAEFIPIVEHTSLARQTTQWVIDAAMRHLSVWRAQERSIVLSINISAENLSEPDLVQRLQLAMLRNGVEAGQLEIELTESAIMENSAVAMPMLAELSSAGISIAIDDFGTGYSSLAYLQSMPAQVIKIDQAFIRHMSDDTSRDFALVETILALSRRLGYRVVAEGIETIEAARLLKDSGCDEGQGYLFSRPLEADRFLEWLDARDRDDMGIRKAA